MRSSPGWIGSRPVGLLLLVVRWVLYYLPSAVLSSTVIMAVSSLVDIATARRLWRQDKSDFWVRRSRAALCPRSSVPEAVQHHVSLGVRIRAHNRSAHCLLLLDACGRR